jgi:hypothetical protein
VRNLSEVIDAMLAEVPETETALVAGLKRIKQSIGYVAPEGMTIWWRNTQSMLVNEVGVPKCDWQDRVANIFVGKAGPR